MECPGIAVGYIYRHGCIGMNEALQSHGALPTAHTHVCRLVHAPTCAVQTSATLVGGPTTSERRELFHVDIRAPGSTQFRFRSPPLLHGSEICYVKRVQVYITYLV